MKLPQGFVLEEDAPAEAVKPPAGFVIEDDTQPQNGTAPQQSVKLPEGFVLEEPTDGSTAQPPGAPPAPQASGTPVTSLGASPVPAEPPTDAPDEGGFMADMAKKAVDITRGLIPGLPQPGRGALSGIPGADGMPLPPGMESMKPAAKMISPYLEDQAGPAVVSASERLMGSMARVPNLVANLAAAPINIALKAAGRPEIKDPAFFEKSASWWDEKAAEIDYAKKRWGDKGENLVSVVKRGDKKEVAEYLAYQTLTNAPQQAIFIASALAGVPAAGLTFAGATSAASALKEGRDAGAGQIAGTANAVLNGVAEAAFEKIGTFGLMNKWGDALRTSFGTKSAVGVMKDVLKSVFASAVGEGNEEFWTSLAQDLSKVVTGVDKNAMRGSLARAVESGAVGAVSGATMTAPGAAGMATRSAAARGAGGGPAGGGPAGGGPAGGAPAAPVLTPEGAKYLAGKFPTFGNLAAPIVEAAKSVQAAGAVQGAIKKAAIEGEKALMSGATPQEADVAAAQVFQAEAQKAVAEIGDAQEPVQEMPPAETAASPLEAPAADAPRRAVRVPKAKVESLAKAKYREALARREQGTTDLERFIVNNGGIRSNADTKAEFQSIPIHLRGSIAVDEMVDMAREAGLEVPNDLHAWAETRNVRGERPRLRDFMDEARRELENDYAENGPPRRGGGYPTFQNAEMVPFESRAPYGERAGERDAQDSGPARAVFYAWQDQGEFGQPFPLYNIVGEHARRRSTVAAETLGELGLEVPATPTFEEWKKGRSNLGGYRGTGSEGTGQLSEPRAPYSPRQELGQPNRQQNLGDFGELQHTLFPAPKHPSLDSLIKEPDFVNLTNDAVAVVEKYQDAAAGNAGKTPSLKVQDYLHQIMHRISAVKRAKKILSMKDEGMPANMTAEERAAYAEADQVFAEQLAEMTARAEKFGGDIRADADLESKFPDLEREFQAVYQKNEVHAHPRADWYDKFIAGQWTPKERPSVGLERVQGDSARVAEERAGYEANTDKAMDKAFAELVDDVALGKREMRVPLTVGNTPKVLQMLGAPKAPLLMNSDVVKKAREKHQIAVEDIKQVAKQIRDPLMVFKSHSQPDSLVAIIEITNSAGEPVSVAVHLNKTYGQHLINRVATISERRIGQIQDWIDRGELRYWNPEKATAHLRHSGLRLPTGGGAPSTNKILSKADLVKGKNGQNLGESPSEYGPSEARMNPPNEAYFEKQMGLFGGAEPGRAVTARPQRAPEGQGTLFGAQAQPKFDVPKSALTSEQAAEAAANAEQKQFLMNTEEADYQVPRAELPRALEESTIVKAYDQAGYLPVHKMKIEAPEDTAAIFAFMQENTVETLYALGLDADNNIVASTMVGVGIIDSTYSPPRDILRGVYMAGAKKVVFVHNHPSHDPTPSDPDLEVTRNVARAAKSVGMELVHHVVINDTQFAIISPDGQVEKRAFPKRTEASGQVKMVGTKQSWSADKPTSITSASGAAEFVARFREGKKGVIAVIVNTKNQPMGVWHLANEWPADPQTLAGEIGKAAMRNNGRAVFLSTDKRLGFTAQEDMHGLVETMRTWGVELLDITAPAGANDQMVWSAASLGLLRPNFGGIAVPYQPRDVDAIRAAEKPGDYEGKMANAELEAFLNKRRMTLANLRKEMGIDEADWTSMKLFLTQKTSITEMDNVELERLFKALKEMKPEKPKAPRGVPPPVDLKGEALSAARIGDLDARARLNRMRLKAMERETDLWQSGSRFGEPALNSNRFPPPEMLDALQSPDDKPQFRDLTLPQAWEMSVVAPIRATEIMDGKRFGLMKKHMLFPLHDADKAFQFELKKKQAEAEKMFKGLSKEERQNIFDAIEKKALPINNRVIETARWLRREYDELLDRLNRQRALVGKDPIRKRADYITHYQELGALADILKMIGMNMTEVPNSMLTISYMTKPNTPYFKFAKERLGEMTERDAKDAYMIYLEPALRSIHFSVPLKSARDILEYKIKIKSEFEGGKTDQVSLFGMRYPNAYAYWTKYLNRLAGKRNVIDRELSLLAEPIGALNRLFAAGSIAGNIGTLMTQPFSIRNTVAETGLFALKGHMEILTPAGMAFYRKNSRVGAGRAYEPSYKGQRMMGSKILARGHDALATALSIPVSVVDGIMVGGAFLAGYHKGKALGLSEKDAIRYADDVAERTQASANLLDRPPANEGKLKVAFGQFQTFVFNEYAQLRYDILRQGRRGDQTYQGFDAGGLGSLKTPKSEGYKRFARMFLASAILSFIAGLLKIPNPLRSEGTTIPGVKNKALNTIYEHVFNSIPYVSAVRFGGSPAAKGIFQGIIYLGGNEAQKKQALRQLTKIGARLIPGGGQAQKTLGAYKIAMAEGDLMKRAKMLMFGKYAVPKEERTPAAAGGRPVRMTPRGGAGVARRPGRAVRMVPR